MTVQAPRANLSQPMRYLLSLIMLSTFCLLSPPQRTYALQSQTFISGGALKQPIRFAAADEDAFFRRLELPPRLDEPPEATGASYTMRTPYWAQAMPGAPGVREPAGEEATYYPQGGYVRALRSDGTTTWVVLDTRQQAIIARYIRLGEQDLISPFPGILQVLKADALAGEAIGVQLGSRQFSEAEAAAFWEKLPVDSRALMGVAPVPIPLRDEVQRPHELPAGSAWVLVTPTEGRTIELLYRYELGLLYDLAGQQAYPVPASLFSSILGSEGAPGSTATAPALVPQDKGPGSPLWWLVAGGLAAALMGGALWLRRGPRVAS